MKLTEKEKAAHRAAFRNMSPAEKLDHIYTYYKWPILLALAALALLGSVLHRQLTKKEPVLYLALVNVSIGSELETGLTTDFLRNCENPGRKEVYLYRELYLSDDADFVNHEYAYASRMKVMGAIQAQKLDLVIMNPEGYDLLSQSGYLLDFSVLLDRAEPRLREQISPYLRSNVVVMEDNSIEWELGEAETHEVFSETVSNAMELSELSMLERAGFEEPLYLGVIANSPRAEEAVRYLQYLLTAP